MDWIFLSPHLDDAALSLGGLIWELAQSGQKVSIWSICAGDPPSGEFSPFAQSLHKRWKAGRQAMSARRSEDRISCHRLGAGYQHLNIPDCIYRRSPKTGEHLYASEEALWLPIHPDEEILIDKIKEDLLILLPQETKLVCPLTIGHHVDHRLTRAVAEGLGIHLYYYAEYPYVCDEGESLPVDHFDRLTFNISPEGMLAWQEAIEAHRSQISTFWESLEDMRLGLQEYYQRAGGIHLWPKNRT